MQVIPQSSTFAEAFRLIGSHPDQELAELAFSMLEREPHLERDDEQSVREGLKHFPDVHRWIKWLLRNDAGSHLGSVFERAVGGSDELTAIKTELEDEGVQAREELDDIDKLVRLAEEIGGSGETIYLLRRLDEEPDTPALNRIGGLPPGIGAQRWPTSYDQLMTHLFTLDIASMPRLQAKFPDSRTLSLFSHDRDAEYTQVVWSTNEQVEADGLELPEELPEPVRTAWFEPVAVEVDVFSDQDSRLHSMIYMASARVLGEPIWLQIHGYCDGEFVMQFDSTFVNINLGDGGVMYVGDHGTTWYCH